MTVERNKLQKRIDNFKSACRESGIKVTHQRLEIFREVAKSEEHPDTRTVFNRVRRRIPEVSLDTVYRTLWLLKDIGMIEALGAQSGHARFDANMAKHHHFICVQCGDVHDFYDTVLDELVVPNEIKKFGNAITTHVEVKGICSHCSNKPKKSAKREKGDE